MYLCSLHSNIKSISTVKDRSQSALVLTEDGSARVVSVTSGRSVTILFPLHTITVRLT